MRGFLRQQRCPLVCWRGGTFAGPAEDGRAAVEKWAAAFNSGDVEGITATYATEPLVWGTVSREMATTSDDVKAYFTRVFSRGFQVQLGDHNVRAASDDAVVDAGQYVFSVKAADGSMQNTPARYLFVIVKQGNDWKISGHHSSVMPAAN